MDLQKKVQDVLEQAVDEGRECGCQAALYINGELAVNAYAGYTDWTKTQAVDENTVFPVFSTGKAPSSTVLHRLVEQGRLSYDTYLRDIWPEFACNGKEEMQVWHVLSYRCGMRQLPQAPTPELAADRSYIVSKMAEMAPECVPGTEQKYHPRTYGQLTSEIACRVVGDNDYFKVFRDIVATPAGMDRFFYGISAEENNAAYLVDGSDGSNYGSDYMGMMNNPLFRQSCNPSTCTMSNALSVARHYAALDTYKLLSKETIDNATKSWRSEDDPMPLQKGRWELFGLGYVLSGPTGNVGQIFGHGGVGGSEGLLDRAKHYAVAITRNVFANPNVMTDFYAAIDFKNRDWPDTAEIPD